MAFSIVQHNINHDPTTSTTCVCTLGGGTTAGNLIVAWTSGGASSVTPTQVTDGTTLFTHATGASFSNPSGPTWESDFYFLPAANAGKTTFTATYSGSSGGRTLGIVEISGFTTPIQNAGGTSMLAAAGIATGTTTIPGQTSTPTAVAALIACTLISDAIVTNPKTGNEFSDGGDIASSGDAWCFKVNATAASHQAQWTAASTSDDYQAGVIAFIDSGGGGSTFVPRNTYQAAILTQ